MQQLIVLGVFMVRVFAVSLVLSCLAAPAWAQPAQVQSTPVTAATPATISATKSVAKKPASKAKAAAKPSEQGNSGPCHFGVIPVVGDKLGVKKIGLTIFGNEYAETPIDSWGLDDLVVAKVRAAAGLGVGVRRIAYAKDSFAPFENPPAGLFRRPEDDLTAIVRRIVGSSNCEHYVVVTKYDGTFRGTNQAVRGVSIVSQGIGDLVRRTYLVTNAQVRIFDGQSFAIRKPSFSLESIVTSSFSGQRGLREIDNASFPMALSDVATNAKLRDEARNLLAETLDYSLLALFKE
ncbi:hypothetical protein [Tardiphaga robiniae]|uniref:Curli production assembly/transport component CsgG n=1 Tax=Tardiphaga robiniae TaxID=943830 RepID=A0A164B1H6_9BRAD|nr:hypothetical protein [Tardiphaga robiniae]KZD25626.1 hypothetical protein A4A58_04285 [Tardiphaga robiniae]